MRFYQPYFKTNTEEQKQDGTYPGYYLVRESDSKLFFISKVVDVLALEEVCSKALSEASGWDYYVDYSYGADIDGKPSWKNTDQGYRFGV